MPARAPRHLPQADEGLVLKAACLTGEAALAAWRTWQSRNDIVTASGAVVDLLPAVYRNLGEATGDDMPLLRGIYRKTRVQNQLLWHRATIALQLLQERQIATLVLKGAAMVRGYYNDPGLRPMLDVDVLVPVDKAHIAYQLLLASGWQPAEHRLGGPLEHVIQVVRSVDLIRADGSRLDLHWHVLADQCDPGDDDEFWAAAPPAEGMAQILCPADILLHTVYHGAKWSPRRSLIWLMDAHRIISGAAETLDWDRFSSQAEKRAAVLPATAALRYLRGELAVDVPSGVIERVERAETNLLPRLDYRAQDSADELLGVALREVSGYLLRTRRRPWLSRFRDWIWYLQAAWGLDHARELPGEVARRLLRRAGGVSNRRG